MTEEQLQVYWADTLSIARFQEKLNAETEEGKYEILKRLLVADFQKFESAAGICAIKPLHVPPASSSEL